MTSAIYFGALGTRTVTPLMNFWMLYQTPIL